MHTVNTTDQLVALAGVGEAGRKKTAKEDKGPDEVRVSIKRAEARKKTVEDTLRALSDRRCPLYKSLAIEECGGCANGVLGHVSGFGGEVDVMYKKLERAEVRLGRLKTLLRGLGR